MTTGWIGSSGARCPDWSASSGWAARGPRRTCRTSAERTRGALYFELFFAEVRDRVLESGLIDAATFDAAAALLKDPEYWTQCWMMTAVWARKPVA